MVVAALVLAVLGIIATIYVAYLVNKKTSRLINRILDIQSAEMPPKKYDVLLRLLRDKRGEYGWIKQNAQGKWVIVWEMEIKEGIELSG